MGEVIGALVSVISSTSLSMIPTVFMAFMLSFLPFFTGAGVGRVDGVVDGDDDGVLVFFEFIPAFVMVGALVATAAALGAWFHAFSQPHATRKA